MTKTDYLTERQALTMIPGGKNSLYQARKRGEISFYKKGNRVYYTRDQVKEYMNRALRGPR